MDDSKAGKNETSENNKSDKDSLGGKIMAIQSLVPILVEAYNKTMSFADNVMSKLDDERYARAINDLYGRTPTDDELDKAINELKIELIKDDTTKTLEEKLEMLDAILAFRDARREKEYEQKKKYAQIVDDGNQKKADVAIKIACGVMTGGVSLIPNIVDATKGIVSKKGEKEYLVDDTSVEEESDGSDGVEE